MDLAATGAARARIEGEPLRAIERTLMLLQNDPSLRDTNGAPVALRVHSMSTRPFSCVAHVDIESAAGVRPVLVKIPRWVPPKADRRLQQLEKEFSAARFLATVFEGATDLGVPAVVAFYPDVPAIVWARLDGATLGELITQSGVGFPGEPQLRALEDACHGAGCWLRALQAATAVTDSHVSRQTMLDYVNVRLEAIDSARPGELGPDLREAVLGVIRDARLTPADLRLAAIHGDFSLSNIMREHGRTVPLDFARFGIGSVYYDVTRLYHQLGLLLHKPWYRPSTVARLRRALLVGYDPELNQDRTVFRLYLIQHLLCHWLGRLKPTAASGPVRGFHWWVGQRHKRELLTLVARLQRDRNITLEHEGVA